MTAPPPLRRAAALVLACAAGSACTVADNLSATEILDELDAIVDLRPAGAATAIEYVARAPVATWYARSFLTLPLRAPLLWLLGGTADADLSLPRAHVRELLRELPDEVGSDPVLAALAVSRLAWIAEFETNPHSRLVALDGLARIAAACELPILRGDFTRLGATAEPERFLAAKAAIAVHGPAARAGGALDAASRRAYAAALAARVHAPLDGGSARIRLLEDVTADWLAETDAAVEPTAAATVRTAMQFVVEGALLRIVQGRSLEEVELRLCAMAHVRAFGGPRSVPLLLAVMASSAADLARGEGRYDPDPFVRLRLIHFCGQLRGELADAVVEWPGRRDIVPLSPAEFLANTILNERDLYSKLRLPALVALTWSLQRPRLDPDPAWVGQWREQRR